jgi:hypothetical protein
MNLRVTMLYLTLCGIGSIANAQPVYRCGPDGRSYSYQPCPGGRTVDVGDRRSVLQRHHAKALSAADRRLAIEMERDRLAREREPKPNAASLGGGAPVDGAEDQRAKATKAKDFKSKGPAAAKPKKPARSAA